MSYVDLATGKEMHRIKGPSYHSQLAQLPDGRHILTADGDKRVRVWSLAPATSASWLNQVERFFAEITAKRIRRGVFKSVAALEAAIKDYLEKHNQAPKPFVWTATAGSSAAWI